MSWSPDAADELDQVRDLSRLRIVTASELPPLGFVGARPVLHRFNPVTMADQPYKGDYVRPRGKPAGGLWTSPLIAGRVPEWAMHHMARSNSAWWRVDPDPEARVLLLDGVNDVLAAIAAFPHRDALQELFSQWRGRETAEIDFAALAEHVDAVWMTAGARHRLMLAADLELVHYTTWDIESVVWLRWRVARAVRLSKCPAEEREGGQG